MMIYFEVLFQHIPRGSEENHINLSQAVDYQTKMQTLDLQNMKQEY